MAFQSGAFQSDAFQDTDAPEPTAKRFGFAGPRQWWLYKGRRLFATHHEIAYLLSLDAEEERKTLKAKRKVRHRSLSREEWGRVMEAMASLNVGMDEPIAQIDDYDDEEASLEVLLAYL